MLPASPDPHDVNLAGHIDSYNPSSASLDRREKELLTVGRRRLLRVVPCYPDIPKTGRHEHELHFILEVHVPLQCAHL